MERKACRLPKSGMITGTTNALAHRPRRMFLRPAIGEGPTSSKSESSASPMKSEGQSCSSPDGHVSPRKMLPSNTIFRARGNPNARLVRRLLLSNKSSIRANHERLTSDSLRRVGTPYIGDLLGAFDQEVGNPNPCTLLSANHVTLTRRSHWTWRAAFCHASSLYVAR